MQNTGTNMKKDVDTIEEAQALMESLYAEKKFIIEVLQLAAGGYSVRWQEHKFYKSLDGKEWPDEVWRTEDGRLLQIQDIEPEHCRNILRMILRQEREAEAKLAELESAFAEALDKIYEGMESEDQNPSVKPVIH